ncbi:MAG: hypothetical protein H0T63_04415 [Pyrinomonadaceae bacterium]|jgi:hypothetical protein|nr:hypothetical protein [Pyrinomonadaceae bacterium]
MKPPAEKLSPKQERALVALLDCGEIQAASERAGVSDVTLWRWLQQPDFQARYRAARRQLVETAIAQLQSDCTTAARVLREVAEDREAPASSRVAAARAIIEQSISAVQLTDLQAEVEEIKRLLAEREGIKSATLARA